MINLYLSLKSHVLYLLSYGRIYYLIGCSSNSIYYSCFIHYVNTKTKSALTSSIPNINYILSVNLRKGIYLIGFVAPILMAPLERLELPTQGLEILCSSI